MSRTYPPLTPYHHEMLDVGDGHRLYVELSGSPSGIPVLFLHGGPGSGLSEDYRRVFDPTRYHIIGFDQRGCGKSTPFASLKNNTTWDLLDDIKRIREHLGISEWMLCGGSWGATLALLAAIQEPATVKALVLRGLFLARQQDIDWFIAPDGGAAQVFPEHYEGFIEHVPGCNTSQSIAKAYDKLLHTKHDLTRLAAVRAWCLWEEWISRLHHHEHEPNPSLDLHRARSTSQLECYYINNQCFIDENYILDNIHKIDHIPGTLIHGRYDMVCKASAAYELQASWSNAKLQIVPEAGHSAAEPAIVDAFCHSTDAYARFFAEEKP